ncbi:substrate-binding periplasmic protein [Psychromonas sp. Urea-02u-13]|uniref:substrate-binding periplasmic protein n=1 Tax=Psychromonas sp. Urea-02u-13 TaxID=2058326 RepID=UPI000C32D493|nr:transporter substrate-binding domain-containing protein [Psychromonas sp. Urea-02u-13]PKG40941.1 transporter [Psychromonas sp. Urea-02u-13]
MKWTQLSWLLLTCSMVSSETWSESLIIAAEDDWAPYSEKDKISAEPVGLAPKLVNAVLDAENLHAKFKTMPFSRCMRVAQSKDILACFNATITDKNRNQYYWHKTPLFKEELSIFSLEERTQRGLTLDSLVGKNVGITIGYTYPTVFMENPDITRFEARSDYQLIGMLDHGRVDFILMNEMPGHLRIKKKGLTGKVVKVGTISIDGFWLAFSKEHPQGKVMSERFEAGLIKIKNNGVYDEIVRDFRAEMGLD